MAKLNESNSFLTNMITSGTNIVGDITCNSDIRIEGNLQGNLTVKGKLVLGATGEIRGEITCQNCDIEGLVDGKIKTQELLSLRATAKVVGDIESAKLAIEPGAIFTGSCSMKQGAVDSKKA
ncbi:MAG: polymer-forming cytoskeletal protein [Bacteroidales bacterium]|jgi:cytoskeletal protein CcmA (bactofilin family)|nr:polymer-forming cytoskeletal protein [Bacteroidales bacterium]